MTICDVCESREPTTEREIAIRYPNQAATEITFDLCEKCEQYLEANANPMLVGMKQLRALERSKLPETAAYWKCVCQKCGKTIGVSRAEQQARDFHQCQCGAIATWEKVEPVTLKPSDPMRLQPPH